MGSRFGRWRPGSRQSTEEARAMTLFTHKTIYAALLGVALAGAPLAAFADEGPRPSSLHNWPGMMQDTAAEAVTPATPGTYGAPNVSPADPVFQQGPVSAID